VGSLEVGKFADFIFLTKDIMDENLPASEILTTSVTHTYVGGSSVYCTDCT